MSQMTAVQFAVTIVVLGAAQAQVWKNRPGNVYACVGDDVTFPWSYHPGMERDVTMVYWRHMDSSRTVAGHHLVPRDVLVVYYPQYGGRVNLMSQTEANAGLVLSDVSEEDAGSYRVELVGTVFTDTAKLQIISDLDLEASIIMDAEEVELSSQVNKFGAQSVDISVSTTSFLSATVLITTNDKSSKVCTESTSCNTTLDLSSVSSPLLTVTIAVYYGICQPREYSVYIEMEENYTGDPGMPPPSPPGPGPRALSKGEIAAIVIVIVLVLVIIGAIIAWALLYKKKSKGYVLDPWQRKYVDLKLFVPLKKSNCFEKSSSRNRSRSKTSGASEVEAGSSIRNLDRELRTLTKEDITVMYDDTYQDENVHRDTQPPEDEDDDEYYDDDDYDDDEAGESKSNRRSRNSAA